MEQTMETELVNLAVNQAALCSVFANPKRVLILWSLIEQEKAVTDIALAIDASLQNTSQHLSLMKAAGILEARREGQTIYYRIAEGGPANRCQLLLDARKSRDKQLTG
jgi:DNA-binding transcriptional ArsR family regulator